MQATVKPKLALLEEESDEVPNVDDVSPSAKAKIVEVIMALPTAKIAKKTPGAHQNIGKAA